METMNSPEIGKLIEALSKVQGAIEGAKQDSANPFFKSKYADLTSVWEACRKPLTEHGLAVVQTIESIGDKLCLVTLLGHLSGQWIKSTLPIPVLKPDPQSLGSAITYCRRYALSAIVGICPIDDDAEAAMNREPKQSPTLTKESSLKQVMKKTTRTPYDLLKDEVALDLDTSQFDEFLDHRAKLAGKSRDAVVNGASIDKDMMQRFKKAYSDWKQEAVNQ